MTDTRRRFDQYLSYVNSAELKQMTRIWGGRGVERKDDCVDLIRTSLTIPLRVREAIGRLTPWEYTALTLLKWLGGIAPAAAFSIGLRATGAELPKSRGWAGDKTTELIEPLIKRGLLLTDYASNPGAIYASLGYNTMVFSDERLLAQAGPLTLPALTLPPAPEPTASSYRRPATVAMDIISVLQAIDKMGGLLLTKAGAVRAADARKLAKALGWRPESTTVDGLLFPNPAAVLPIVLYQANLLEQVDDRLHLTVTTEQFARQSYPDQIAGLFQGFIRTLGWREWGASDWYDANDSRPSQARLALALTLASLSTEARAFFTIDDLDQALFDRIGEYFSLSFMAHLPYPYNKTPDQIKREQETWHKKLRDDWLKRERIWLESALTSWLYYLGIVELELAGDQPVSLRLTDLGRAVLHPELGSTLRVAPQSGAGAWLIQPDFEVTVYLDRATAEQIAFLERHTERVQAQQHIVRYKITREAIYQGLESGTSSADLLAGLRAGASVEPPQNVLTTIRDWAAQRERITLRRSASLLEFADAATRQVAIDQGVQGALVGDRFLRIADSAQAKGLVDSTIDYMLPLPASLIASEDGVLTLAQNVPDLLLRPQLDHWAEHVDERTWRLTADSVAAAVKAKQPIGELFDLLSERLTHSLPPLLRVALDAWAGNRPKVAVANISVLRCTRLVVFAAIASSPMFAPYLRGTLAPDLLLVDAKQIKQLKERLAWAGLDVADVIEVT